MSLQRQFAGALRSAIGRSGAETLLLGVSGGVDSTALLHLTVEMKAEGRLPEGLALRVLHFEHGIRGAESLEDARFVCELANRLGVPAELAHAPEGALSERQNALEARARSARYAFFERAAQDFPKPMLVLAHHMEDQSETILLHLLRGAGAEGLIGMRTLSRRAGSGLWIARPLLGVHKAQLADYCTARGLSWREDSSNADNRYRRNGLRNVILPQLRSDYNPNLDETLLRTSRLLEEEDDYLETEAARHLASALGETNSPNAVRLRAIGLSGRVIGSLHPAMARRVLRRFLRIHLGWHTGITQSDIESIRALFGGTNGKKQRIYDMIFLCDFGDVLVMPATLSAGRPTEAQRVEAHAFADARVD